MIARTSMDIAVAARAARIEHELSQESLAQRAGVSRKWLIDFEAGKPSVELHLVLRILAALNLDIHLTESPPGVTKSRGAVDLDALIDEHRRTA